MADSGNKVQNRGQEKVQSKEEALENALKRIDKQFGKGTLMRLGEREKIEMEVIPTGSIALDSALGVGGIPKGRITEIYGPESSGKTTVALHIVAECQKEQALEICDELARSGAVDIIVVDSVAALTPRAEIEGDMGDTHVGLLARLMSQALRKMTGNISKNNTTMVFINQVREKIGVMYGNPEVTTGGRALKFYSSVRMEVRKGEALKRGSETAPR